MSLADLLAQATDPRREYEWESFWVNPDTARLATLAPGVSQWAIDAAAALQVCDQLCSRSGCCADFPSLLARFAALDAKAGEQT